MFVTRLGALVGHGGYSLAGAPRQADEETVVVTAEVQPSAGAGAAAPQRFDFHLRRKRVGPRKGAWTTWMLVAADGEAA